MSDDYQRVHRVGTITLGLCLVIFGVLFLLKMVWSGIDYLMIMRLWPMVFVFLGVEVLLSCKKSNVVYDKAGIVLLTCLIFFAMVMGWLDSAYVKYFM